MNQAQHDTATTTPRTADFNRPSEEILIDPRTASPGSRVFNLLAEAGGSATGGDCEAVPDTASPCQGPERDLLLGVNYRLNLNQQHESEPSTATTTQARTTEFNRQLSDPITTDPTGHSPELDSG